MTSYAATVSHAERGKNLVRIEGVRGSNRLSSTGGAEGLQRHEGQGAYGRYRLAQAFLHPVCPPARPDPHERRVLSRELPQHASHGSLRDVELGRELGERRESLPAVPLLGESAPQLGFDALTWKLVTVSWWHLNRMSDMI